MPASFGAPLETRGAVTLIVLMGLLLPVLSLGGQVLPMQFLGLRGGSDIGGGEANEGPSLRELRLKNAEILKNSTLEILRAAVTEGRFDPTNVTNHLLSLKELGFRPDAPLLEALQRRSAAAVDDFNPWAVAHLLATFSAMGIRPDATLLESMQRHATATAHKFNIQSVALLLGALAKMSIPPDAPLLEAMQLRATATVGHAHPMVASMLKWAFDTMGITPDEPLRVVMQRRYMASTLQPFLDKASADQESCHLGKKRLG